MDPLIQGVINNPSTNIPVGTPGWHRAAEIRQLVVSSLQAGAARAHARQARDTFVRRYAPPQEEPGFFGKIWNFITGLFK